MRPLLGFFSLLAIGFLGAGVLSVVASGSLSHMPLGEVRNGDLGGLDLGSLLLGVAAGVLLSAVARISWAELPQRTVTWLLANERNFARLAWAGLFIIVLFFY